MSSTFDMAADQLGRLSFMRRTIQRSAYLVLSAACFLSIYLLPATLAMSQTAMVSVKITPHEVTQNTAKMLAHYEPATMLRFTISLKPQKPAELSQFNQQLYDKNSPNFHKFLTAEQWASRFAPNASDEQMILDWAASNGFSVTARHPHRLAISLEASSERVEQAFGVKINHYQLGTRAFYSNDRDPVVPAQMASVIESLDGLSSLAQEVPHSTGQRVSDLEPQYSPGPAVMKVSEGLHDADPSKMPEAVKASLAAKQAADPSGVADPTLTDGRLDPTELYNPGAYNWEGLNNMKKCCNPFHAAGSPPEASIAVVSIYSVSETDIGGFRTIFPYLADNWTAFNVDGTPTCPDATCHNETTLDFEAATEMANSFGAAADTAHVYIYQGANAAHSTIIDLFSRVLSDNKARIVTYSWGCAESSCYGDSTMRSIHNVFEAMIAQGYTILVASGDQGATASTGDGNCSSSLAVEYPASDPDVVAVGGTALNLSNSDTFLSEGAWQGSTAKGACSQNNGGSGGGLSSFWDRPAYQADLNNTKRSVPDMALNSGSSENFFFGGKAQGVIGTSIASPHLAGFFAQENAYLLTLGNICGSGHQTACSPLGLPHPAIYTLGKFPRFIGYTLFYDVTTGCNNNDVTVANNLTAYCAGTGYDMVTGWGSINALYFAWGINAYLAGDFLPPTATWSGVVPDVWHNTDQVINWNIQDVGHDLYVPNGVAGYSQEWDSAPNDLVDRTATLPFHQPQFPNMSTGSASLSQAGEGCHHMLLRVWDNGGATGVQQSPSYCYDTIPPVTSAIVTGAQSGGVFTSSATVTIQAEDRQSGIGTISYRLGPLYQAYTGPLVITQPGTYNLTYYSSDKAGNADQTRALTFTVKTSSTTTHLSSSVTQSPFGASVMLTAVVTSTTGVVPTGTVTFQDGATVLGTTSLNGGRAVLSVNALHAGSHSLGASYNGSATALPSNSNSVVQTVSPSSSITTVSFAPSSVAFGHPVVFTATVASSHGGAVSGSVSFNDRGVLIGTVPLNAATKMAAFTTSTLVAGTHSIAASYSGNPDNLAGTSVAFTYTVTKTTATTVLVSSFNPSIYGKPVTLSATVSPSSGSPVTGTVLFKDGTRVVGTALVDGSTHKAAAVVPSFDAGSHSLSATYIGDINYESATSATLTETVAKAAATVTLSTSPNPSMLSRPVTFTATVTPEFGGSVSGPVDFEAGGVKFASPAVSAITHQASYNYAALPVGNNVITLHYEGNANLNPADSNAVTQVVK